ncbi:MAG: molybdopterin-dependent oxidoreductase, partial [Burkholderiales bacterium]|nr:molybdopterin-dependent oxidoreductase [Burkholderiales bacterium]
KPGTRVLNAIELGRWLTEDPSPPIRSLFVCNSNPLSQGTEQNRIREGLQREDLFTVVSELVLTDTARYADIVLPATMQAEQLDLMYSWGHMYLTLNQPAIEPPGEAVSNTELFRRLAGAMGFTDPEWQRTDEQMIIEFVDWNHPKMQGITLDALKQKGFIRLNIAPPDQYAPHADGNFPTPSGKCEFKSSMAEKGNFVNPFWRQMYAGAQPTNPIDPLPDFLPPFESPASNPALAAQYPLSIVSPKAHAFLSSQLGNDEIQLKRQGEQLIVIHPEDAESRGIASGTFVRVWNARGAFEGKALVSDDVMRGVVLTNIGYWLGLSRNGNAANIVTSDQYGAMANTAVFSDTLVEVALTDVTPVTAGAPAARAAQSVETAR